ncbi:MAG: hypothetical protein JSW05_02530 [Candidatus Thorarchaeota archaeon]|nr:MAG: hypothetical protein JSW05_02530 [Candidatus Thorarchaeota archaeon]
MNWPIYQSWHKDSRRCYARLLVAYAVLLVIFALLYVVRLLDVMTLIITVVSSQVIVLVTTAYMVWRNPPVEYREIAE